MISPHARHDHRDIGVRQRGQGGFQRFGAEKTDDDLHLLIDELLRCCLATIGGAAVISDHKFSFAALGDRGRPIAQLRAQQRHLSAQRRG